MNILKNLKRLLIITGISILLFFSGAFIYLYLNRSEINALLLKQISQQINFRFTYSDINVSLFHNFPNASVSLENFILSGTLKDNNAPLLKMKNLRFSFNLIDIYHHKYYFKTLTFEEGQINFMIHPDGKTNFELFKEKDKKVQKSDLEIQKVKLKNTEIIFHNQKEKVFTQFLIHQLQIENKTQKLKGEVIFNGELLIKKLNLEYDAFPENLPAKISATLHINPKEKKVQSHEFKLTLKNINSDITFDFNYGSQKYYKSVITLEEARLKEIFSVVPPEWHEEVSPYLAEGLGSLKIKLYGSVENSTPHFAIEFQCKKSILTDSDKKWKIENADFHGSFSNGEGREPGTSTLNIASLTGLFMNRMIKANLTMRNFYNPWVSITTEGSLETNRIPELYPLKNINLSEGDLDFFIQWEGRPGRDAPTFMRNIMQKATFKGNDIGISFTGNPDNISNELSHFEINKLNFNMEWAPDKIISNHLVFSTPYSDYTFTETVLLIPETNTVQWNCNTVLHSDKLDLNELSSVVQVLFKSHENTPPLPLSLKININCKQLLFIPFKASDVKGIIVLESDKINLSNFSFSTMEGSVFPELEIASTPSIQKHIQGMLRLEKINIKKLFQTYPVLNTETLSGKNLSGEVSGFIHFEALVDSLRDFDWNKTNGNADLWIRAGKLADYKPLQKLARFADTDLLDNLKFKEIHSVFSFREGTILFPVTEIISNVTTLWFSGTISKAHEFDLRVKIRLPKHPRKHKTQEEEMSVIEDDGLGNTLLFIKINGTPEKLKITYDTEAVKNRIKESWEKEKKEFKDIFKKESQKDSVKSIKLSEEEFKFDE